MKTPTRFGVSALVVVSSLSAAAQGPPRAGQVPPRDGQPSAVTGTATIRGLVVQLDTGQPVRRVQITARASEAGSQLVSAMTDAAGRFELTKLPAGRYQLAAAKAGFVTVQHGQRRPLEPGRPHVVAEGQKIENVNFNLPRGSVIVGQVVDEFGDPVTGANIGTALSLHERPAATHGGWRRSLDRRSWAKKSIVTWSQRHVFVFMYVGDKEHGDQRPPAPER